MWQVPPTAVAGLRKPRCVCHQLGPVTGLLPTILPCLCCAVLCCVGFRPFFDACDSIFINYGWKKRTPALVREEVRTFALCPVLTAAPACAASGAASQQATKTLLLQGTLASVLQLMLS